MIDAGSEGPCILANFFEQFVLTNEEREQVVLRHVAAVYLLVTATHFGTAVRVECSRRAWDTGAAMVMIMPPCHGATIVIGKAGSTN